LPEITTIAGTDFIEWHVKTGRSIRGGSTRYGAIVGRCNQAGAAA
jgi:hypothetical protein